MNSDKKYLAVIDLGSNSFNLMLANNESLFRPIIKRFNITVQLAKYLNSDNTLSQDGINACSYALKILGEILSPFAHSLEVRCNATYTIRSAINKDELFARIKEVFPYNINVISGETEALNIYRGICLSYPIQDKFIAFDIGGGSTETILSEKLEAQYAISCNLGCVSFTHKYFPNGIISRERYQECYQAALEVFKPLQKRAQELGFINPKYSFGSSGTVKTILNIVKTGYSDIYNRLKHLATLPESQTDSTYLNRLNSQISRIENWRLTHEVRDLLTPEDLDFIIDLVLEYSSARELIHHHFDITEREVLVGGICILRAIITSFGITQLQYSDTALREGIMFQELKPADLADLRSKVLEHYIHKYHIDPIILESYTAILQALVNQIELPFTAQEVYSCAVFSQCGKFIDEDNATKNAYYIFKNSTFFGLSAQELEIIPAVLGYQANQTCRKFNNYGKLALLMDLAEAFACTSLDQLISSNEVRFELHSCSRVEIHTTQQCLAQHPYVNEFINRIRKKSKQIHLKLDLNIK